MDSSDIHMTETDLMKFLTLLPKMKLERSEKPIETVLATDSSLYYVSLSLSLSCQSTEVYGVYGNKNKTSNKQITVVRLTEVCRQQ